MKTKLFILVLMFQCAWILGTAFTQERALRMGRIILLETQPVDPRDWLRGDYLRLNYKISDIPRERFFPPMSSGGLPSGATVFVALVPKGTNQFHEIARASTERFAPVPGEVLIRGTVAGNWWSNTGPIHVEYGIEQYYVAEGTGNPHAKLTVQVIVAQSGRVNIKEVFADGKPYIGAVKVSSP
jgi:uncharacterized membrane-anchored protein